MVDNFESIKTLMSWDNNDEFYYVQVLKRKKENIELGSNSHVVKTYFIRDAEQLERDREEMKLLANFHNARVYINLNKRSFERTAFHTLKKITDIILNKDYPSARRAYTSVCGSVSTGDKTWVIDVDTENINEVNEVVKVIEDLQPLDGKSKIIDIIPTKNGFHIISKPFNVKDFKDKFPDIDVHKNNPTCLFIP